MTDLSVLGVEDENDSICSISDVQRNLGPLFDASQRDYLEVFLRIKPIGKDENEQEGDQKYLNVESSQALVVHPPREAIVPPPSLAGAGMGCGGARNRQHVTGGGTKPQTAFGAFHNNQQQQSLKFTFSRIFDESTNQKTFFDESVQSTVREFLEGQNCLLFAYGVTNSGKTYTMQGMPSDAGVVPRTFDVIFNSIGDRLYGRCDLKPSRFCDVESLDEESELREIALKESILRQIYSKQKKQISINFSSSDVSKSISNCSADDSTRTEEEISTIVANRRREQASVAVGGSNKVHFSIWASFAEVYNEQVYDLLVPPPEDVTRSRKLKATGRSTLNQGKTSNATGYQRNTRAKGSSPPYFGRRERVTLQLKEDVQGRPYISGLREVNVTSADEAFKLLTLGRRNLQMAYTRLNESSSRSHCIFTLKLMRVLESNDGSGIKHTKFNILSLCDLAGIERSCKTQNIGERVKEAGNINNSLFTLGRCIQAIRHNQISQTNDRQLLPPFRDSKLTRLFQSFLTGRGKASMIVTVSQCRSMYPENLNAIKFSAIAKQVTLIPVQVCPIDKPFKPSIDPQLQKHKLNSRQTIEWATASEVKRHKMMPIFGKQSVEEEVEEEDESDDSDATVNEDESHSSEGSNDSQTEKGDDSNVSNDEMMTYVKKLEEENACLKKDKLNLEGRIDKINKDSETHIVGLHTKYEDLLERAELRHEDELDKKVELLTSAYEKKLKRPRCDDYDARTRDSLTSRIKDLEEELQTTCGQLANWKQNYDLSNREMNALTREITEVKFRAAAERMEISERSSLLEMENLDLKAQLEKMKEQNEVVEDRHKNERTDMERNVCDLERRNRSLTSTLDSHNILMSSNDSELAKLRNQNMELLLRIKQLERMPFQDASHKFVSCDKSLGLGDMTSNNLDLSHLLDNMTIGGATVNYGKEMMKDEEEETEPQTESHCSSSETDNESDSGDKDSDKDLFSDSINLDVYDKNVHSIAIDRCHDNDSFVKCPSVCNDTRSDVRKDDNDATVDYQGDDDDKENADSDHSNDNVERDSLEMKQNNVTNLRNISLGDLCLSPPKPEKTETVRVQEADGRFESMPYIDQSGSEPDVERDCLESSDLVEPVVVKQHQTPESSTKFLLSTSPQLTIKSPEPSPGLNRQQENSSERKISASRIDSDGFLKPDDVVVASLYRSTRRTKQAGSVKSVRTNSKKTNSSKFETPRQPSKERSSVKSRVSEDDDDDSDDDSDVDDDFVPKNSIKKSSSRAKKTKPVAASNKTKRTIKKKVIEDDDDSMISTKENSASKSTMKASHPVETASTTGKRRNVRKLADDKPFFYMNHEDSLGREELNLSPLSSLKRHLRSRKL